MVLRAQTEVTQLDVAFLLDLWLGKLISGKRQEPYYVRDKGTLQFKANLWNNGIRQARKLENSVTLRIGNLQSYIVKNLLLPWD